MTGEHDQAVAVVPDLLNQCLEIRGRYLLRGKVKALRGKGVSGVFVDQDIRQAGKITAGWIVVIGDKDRLVLPGYGGWFLCILDDLGHHGF